MLRHSLCHPLFLQRLHRDFLEKHDVVVAVILQPDITVVRARTALRFEVKFPLGHGIAFGVVRHFHAIYLTIVCGPSRVISIVFHSGPGFQACFTSGLVNEYSVPVT